jgi:hypothetical protein
VPVKRTGLTWTPPYEDATWSAACSARTRYWPLGTLFGIVNEIVVMLVDGKVSEWEDEL